MASPGIYISLSKVGDDETVIPSLDLEGVTGVIMRIEWKVLETSEGIYSDTEIQAHLDAATNAGLQLIVMIVDKSFDGTTPTPAYLESAGGSPPYVDTNSNGGSTGIRWKTYYQTRFNLLIDHLAASFDSDANFEGIAFQETAIGFTAGQNTTHSYTSASYVTALQGFYLNATTEFASSEVFPYINFIPDSNPDIAVMVNYAVTQGAVPGGPDLLPQTTSGSLNQTGRLYPSLRAQRANPTFIAIQNDSYSWQASDTNALTPPHGTFWSPEELQRYALYDIGAAYTFYNRWENRGPAEAYVWDDAATLNAIRYYGKHESLTKATHGYTIVRPAKSPSATLISDVFLDVSAGSDGDGTAGNPWNVLSSVAIADNTALRVRRGTTVPFTSVTAGIDVAGGVDQLEISSYGNDDTPGSAVLGGTTAIFDGAITATTWNTTAETNIWIWATTADNDHGVITEDGLPLDWVEWNTNLATTAAAMGQGSYTYNGSNAIYVRSSDDADPDTHTMRISRTRIGFRVVSATANLNFWLHDVKVQMCSRQGSNTQDVAGQTINDVWVQYTGGATGGGVPIGGSIQAGPDSTDGNWWDNILEEPFDSPMSPQIYANSTSIDNFNMSGNICIGGALGGMEAANFNTGGSITNITVQYNHFSGSGAGFSSVGDHGTPSAPSFRTCGIIVWGNNAGIDGFTITDNTFVMTGTCYAGINIHECQPDNIVIRRNKIVGAERGIRNHKTSATAGLVTIEHNEVLDCLDIGILDDQSSGTEASVIRKNTVDNCNVNIQINNADTVVPVYADNLMTNGTTGSSVINSTLTVEPSHNNAFGNTANFSGHAVGNNTTLSPGYFSDADTDFNIPTDSLVAGIGSGFAGWPSETDRLGRTYTTDDLGAFRSGGVGPAQPDHFVVQDLILASVAAPQTISSASQANPCVLTITGHNFANDDVIYVDGVVGMTELNGNFYTVSNQLTNSIELFGLNSTGFTAYSSAGTAYHSFDWTHGSNTNTPTGSLHFSGRSNVINSPVTFGQIGFGMCDGTDNRMAIMNTSDGEATSTDTNSRMLSNACAGGLFNLSAGVDGEWRLASYIPGGSRMIAVDATGGNRMATSMFFTGSSAKVLTATLNATVDVAVNVDPGFAWNVVFITGVCGPEDTSNTTGQIYFGWYNKSDHVGILHASQHATAVASAGQGFQISNVYAGGEISETTGAIDYGIEVSAGAGTSCDLTPRINGGDGDPVYCLFLGLPAGQTAQSTLWSSATATGVQSIDSIGQQPVAAINLYSYATGYSIAEADADAGSFGAGMVTAADEYSVSLQNEFQASPSNTQGLVADSAINIPTHAQATGMVATYSSFDSNGWSYSWTSVDGTARNFATMSFGATVSEGVSLTPSNVRGNISGYSRPYLVRPKIV